LKAGKIGPGGLSKVANVCTTRFIKRELFDQKNIFSRFQNRRVDSGRLSKALCAAPRNLLTNRSKEFELANFEKLFANSIAFHAKVLRIR
jgi:hypothetical protein